jgi:hypothetical protein
MMITYHHVQQGIQALGLTVNHLHQNVLPTGQGYILTVIHLLLQHVLLDGQEPILHVFLPLLFTSVQQDGPVPIPTVYHLPLYTSVLLDGLALILTVHRLLLYLHPQVHV